VTDLVIILGSLAAGFLAGCVASALFLVLVNKRAQQLHNIKAGAVGRQARAEQEDRMMAAVAEFGKAVQEGKPMQDALKETAMKYPDVALKIGKKVLSGKMNLGDLGGE